MEAKFFYKELNKLMLPIAFQAFMLALVAASDTIMLGFVSQVQLAAVSLATRVQFVQNIGIAGLVGGGLIICAQLYGRKEIDKINKIFATMTKYVAILSIIFWGVSFFAPDFLMRIFTNDINMIEIGSQYLKIASWSYLIVGITQCYITMMRVGNKANLAMISSLSVVVNIILNAFFIFGLFGIPKMEARGAALATVIARIIELGITVILFTKFKDIKLKIVNIFKIDLSLDKLFLKMSAPIFLNESIWGIGITIYSVFIGHLGEEATAANSIASVIKDLVTSLCRGIGVGGGILLGYKLGVNDFETAKRYGNKLLKLSVIVGIVCSVLVLALSPISNLFELSSKANSYLWIMILICMVYMIAKSINICAINGIFYAGGDTKFDAYSLGVTMWGIIIPLAAIGTFICSWPVLVIYLIISLDEIIKIPWVFIHYKKYKWLKNIT